jgi:hypothetical protein
MLILWVFQYFITAVLIQKPRYDLKRGEVPKSSLFCNMVYLHTYIHLKRADAHKTDAGYLNC